MYSLDLRRKLPATAEQVFDAWTNEDALLEWWGPVGVRCVSASVDLKVGGHYQILNELPDGNRILIRGEFKTIERPRLLVYTWIVDLDKAQEELVTVTLNTVGEETEIQIRHDRITDKKTKNQHEAGWSGCLGGLIEYFDGNLNS